MEIPVQNIYYLLCYAWNKLDERDLVKIEPADSTNLVDLFAKVLIGGIGHLLKRGFDRGYVQFSEETRHLRGRIVLGTTLKRDLLRKGMVCCEYDELSYNVLHNRILKSTIRNLLRSEEIDKKLREGLFAYYHRLAEVDEIELSAQVFRRVQLNRNNYFYDFLVRVCELLYTNLLPTEKGGAWRFRSFLQDEHQMRRLFEEFIRNFYKHEATSFTVKRDDIYWRLAPASVEGAQLLPEMQTDVTLTSSNRKIIVECKFTPEVFQAYYGTPKLRSEHLYQLNAYLTNLPESEINDTCQGILLYPATGASFSQEYAFPKGRKLSVRTINLNQTWKQIHKDLMAFVS